MNANSAWSACSNRQVFPLIEDDIYGDLYFGEHRPAIARCYDRQGAGADLFIVLQDHRARLPDRLGRRRPLARRCDRMEAGDLVGDVQPAADGDGGLPAQRRYERHLVRAAPPYRLQVEKMRFMLARHLPEGTRISNPQGGFVLWVEMPRGIDALNCQLGAARKISLTPGMMFSATRKFRNFVRVNCGYPWMRASSMR